jgi:hypothetical protein
MDRKTKSDFYEQVESDMQTLNIDREDILSASKDKLKELLKGQVCK